MEITVNLDRAAYYLLIGAELIAFGPGTYHNCKFVVLVTPEMIKLEKTGLVNYKKYAEKRTKLKRRTEGHFGYIRGGKLHLGRHATAKY